MLSEDHEDTDGNEDAVELWQVHSQGNVEEDSGDGYADCFTGGMPDKLRVSISRTRAHACRHYSRSPCLMLVAFASNADAQD